MTAAAPRKKASGERSMRPYRIGTSSGTRVRACSSSNPTGSGRSGAGSQSACVERRTSARAAFPRAARSAGVACSGRAVGISHIVNESLLRRRRRSSRRCAMAREPSGVRLRAWVRPRHHREVARTGTRWWSSRFRLRRSSSSAGTDCWSTRSGASAARVPGSGRSQPRREPRGRARAAGRSALRVDLLAARERKPRRAGGGGRAAAARPGPEGVLGVRRPGRSPPPGCCIW